MSFLILANRLDVIAELLKRLIAATTGVPIDELPDIVIPPPEIVISQPMLPNRYKLFRIDLSIAHTDEPIGLAEMLAGVGQRYASYMSVITEPNPFTFKLNSTDMDAIDASVGLEMDDFEITEIFYSNAAAAGTALVNVEYRVD